MMRSPPSTRWAYATAYLLFAIAGGSAALWPSPAVEKTSRGGWILTFWVVALIAGGLSSAWGRATARWMGEFLGLPLLGTVMIIYGLSATYSGIVEGRLTALPGGAALLAMAAFIVGRWAEINSIRLEAVRLAELRHAEARRIAEGAD